MIYLYYCSIVALLASIFILLYDWQNNRPTTIRGTLIDNGDLGLFLKLEKNDDEGDIPVKLARGFTEDLTASVNNVNGLNGLFLIINQYIFAGAIGMTTILNYDDLSLKSPYMAPNPLYWLGLPAIIIIFFIKTYKDNLFDPLFFVPMLLFCALVIYAWIFIYLLKAKFIAWQTDQFITQFQCMRRAALNQDIR